MNWLLFTIGCFIGASISLIVSGVTGLWRGRDDCREILLSLGELALSTFFAYVAVQLAKLA